jgi:16S rRNA (adenine1518-N6/adenine1519-N6)-dimethyltransferase
MTTPRQILKMQGLRPLKRLSQTFLEDRNITSKIIGILDIQCNDVVIEIGAGMGIMTEEIAKSAGKVIAIEIDPYMMALLTKKFKDHLNVEIIHSDVLAFDFSLIRPLSPTGMLKVIGNVPYHISSQILFRLIDNRRYIERMVLMFQKELADRICAGSGSREYGIPSVLVDMYAVCTREMTIPPHCFYPAPKIMSSVLKMVIRDKPQVNLKNHDLFIRLVKMAFSKRRKTLLNNLKGFIGHGYFEDDILNALQDAGIDGQRRGETLSPIEFGRLSNAFYCQINIDKDGQF